MDEYEREADEYLSHPGNDGELEYLRPNDDYDYMDDIPEPVEQEDYFEPDNESMRESYHPPSESLGDQLPKLIFYATMAYIGFGILRFIYLAIMDVISK